MRRRLIGLVAVLVCATGPAFGSGISDAAEAASVGELGLGSLDLRRITASDVALECTGGSQRDDGTLEDGYRIPFAGDARFVQHLRPESYPAILEQVCICWKTSQGLQSMSYNVIVYDDDGAAGRPGTLLGGKPVAAVNIDPFVSEWQGYDCADLSVTVESGGVYVGAQWNAAAEVPYFICSDTSPSTPPAQMFQSSSGGQLWTPVTSTDPEARALGIRARFAEAPEVPVPPPPPTGPITSPELEDFRFWVRISDSRIGTPVADCLPETVCVAGAIPTRAEVFVRIVGPKPNGYLWPNIVKFNTTKTEVWIEQISTGSVRYYLLPALQPDSDTLPGIVDKKGFLPQ